MISNAKQASEERTFTTGEIARMCGFAPQTINRRIDDGLLPGFRIPDSNHRRVRAADLARFLRENGVPVPAEIAHLSVERVVLAVGAEPAACAALQAHISREFTIASTRNGFEAGIALMEQTPVCIVFHVGASEVRGWPKQTNGIVKIAMAHDARPIESGLFDEIFHVPPDPALLAVRIETLIAKRAVRKYG